MVTLNYPIASAKNVKVGDIYVGSPIGASEVIRVSEDRFSYRDYSKEKLYETHKFEDEDCSMKGLFLRPKDGKLEVIAISKDLIGLPEL